MSPLHVDTRDVNEARRLEAKAETEAQIVCKNITVQKQLLITRSLSIFVLFVCVVPSSHTVILSSP